MRQALPSSSTCKHVTLSISPDTEEPHSTFPAYGIGAVGLFRALWVSGYLEGWMKNTPARNLTVPGEGFSHPTFLMVQLA